MKYINLIVILLGKIRWEKIRYLISGKEYSITTGDALRISFLLKQGNYIILTRRKSHLSTYMTSIANLILMRRIGYYSHACINIEPDVVDNINKIQIIESIGSGVRKSEFWDVFNCDSVVLMRPRNILGFDWEKTVEECLSDIGKQYDGSFNLDDYSKVSCVELILWALKTDPMYHIRFNKLESMIRKYRNLTPDMFYLCGDFETVLEIRK